MNALEYMWPEYSPEPDIVKAKTLTVNIGGSWYVFLVRASVTESEFYDFLDRWIDENFGRSTWLGIMGATEVSEEFVETFSEQFKEANMYVEGA